MFARTLGVPVALVAAAGLPYAVSNAPDNFWGNGSNQEQVQPIEPSLPTLPDALTTQPQGPENPIYSTASPLEGIRNLELSEIIRFDVSKEWVYQNWARKSTALAELGLYGVRVPLVTGTQLRDLAGSLTYYFDPQGKVQRISFRGNTGDTTDLVMLISHVYGLQWQSTPIAGEQLYQIRRGNDVLSECRTRPAPVLWANSPHESFTVELELQRPGSTNPLPREKATPATPPAQQPQANQNPSNSTEAAQNSSQSSPEEPSPQAGKEKWDVLFPRSRVPKTQVENLEKRDRFW